MLKLTLGVMFLVAGIDRAFSWGGRFNRFSPEMLSNMGYGGYGNNRHAPQVGAAFYTMAVYYLFAAQFASFPACSVECHVDGSHITYTTMFLCFTKLLFVLKVL